MNDPSGNAVNEPRQEVWILQHRIMHYRVPVWDMLERMTSGHLHLKVFGRMDQGRPFGGGEQRGYLNDPVEDAGSNRSSVWDAIKPQLRHRHPAVLISETNPRFSWCWRLPMTCQRLGIVPVAWTKVKSNDSKLPKPVLRFVKKRLFQRYALYLVYGSESRKELISLGINPGDIFIAHNTIDTRRVFEHGSLIQQQAQQLRTRWGLEGKRIVLAIARMDPKKRVNDLLDAWPALRKIDPNLVLVLVGGGRLLENIKQRAQEIDPDRIIVTGRVPEGEDYAWISAADINVQPGAVGLAINQSMALGTATMIADERGPDTEALVHGKTGWRYPKGNLDALAALVHQLLLDQDTTKHVTENARSLMRDKITVQNMALVMHNTIQEALCVGPADKGVA